MGDDRSLKDLLLESADDLESIVKQMIDALLNRDKNKPVKNGETVTNLVTMFDAKQYEVRKLLARVPEFQAREELIQELKKSVAQRDTVIQKVEWNLKAAEVAITAAVFQASTKLKAVREAEIRPVNSETVVKLAHQISRHYSVSAPLTWQQGDPTRPFPQEHEFRVGWLSNPKTHYTASLTHPVGLLRQGSNQSIRTPPTSGRVTESPTFNQVPGQQPQKVWSPRSGYGPSDTSPLVLASRRVTPQLQNQWPPGSVLSDSSPFSKNVPSVSPEASSPSLKVKISGVVPGTSRVAPPPLRNVEQMSSDSSSSSSSEDESQK